MAESEQQPEVQNVEEDEEDAPKVQYKPPAEKSLDDILKADEEDESLRKYKEQLLGQAASDKKVFCKYCQHHLSLVGQSLLFNLIECLIKVNFAFWSGKRVKF